MKGQHLVVIFFLMTLLSSCELVGGIFKAGMWWGIILVVGVLGIFIFILSKMFGGK